MNLQGIVHKALVNYQDSFVIVEGKRDVAALEHLGFTKVYAIHQTSVSIRERVLNLAMLLGRKEKVCILTDFDKKGVKLHSLLVQLFNDIGANVDYRLRKEIRRLRISHIEGMDSYFSRLSSL